MLTLHVRASFLTLLSHVEKADCHARLLSLLQHLEQSRSQRIVWLLEELGVEYEIKSYPRVVRCVTHYPDEVLSLTGYYPHQEPARSTRAQADPSRESSATSILKPYLC